jgi:hypothetical protein
MSFHARAAIFLMLVVSCHLAACAIPSELKVGVYVRDLWPFVRQVEGENGTFEGEGFSAISTTRTFASLLC